jgi:hypothetical protein
MRLTRRELTLAGGAALVMSSASIEPAAAQGGDEAAVAAAVEALRQAMLAADKEKLLAVAHDKLSYSHSSGATETKEQYAAAIASKKTIFKTLTFGDQTIAVVGDNAIVRNTFAADLDRSGKADAVKIGVLQVWKKDGGAWKLLARQGYKL